MRDDVFLFEVRTWLSDECLSRCSPQTRGIWIDVICHMHLTDHSGVITATVAELARSCRCSVVEMQAAIDELNATVTSNVTRRNENVTLVSRKIQRAYNKAVKTKERVRRWRRNASVKKSPSFPSSPPPEVSPRSPLPTPPSLAPQPTPSSHRRYPATLEEALKLQPVSTVIPQEFVSRCFDKAESRGGKDAKGIPIADFNAYVRTEWIYEQDRIRTQKGRGHTPAGDRNAGTYNEGRTAATGLTTADFAEISQRKNREMVREQELERLRRSGADPNAGGGNGVPKSD